MSSAAAVTSAAVVGNGPDSVQLSLKDASWVSVQDATRQKLIAEIRPAGQTLTLRGSAPFWLNIGNPNAVTITFNGKTIDAKSFIDANGTATIKLRP
jgi:cytoskeleton protein RodZ